MDDVRSLGTDIKEGAHHIAQNIGLEKKPTSTLFKEAAVQLGSDVTTSARKLSSDVSAGAIHLKDQVTAGATAVGAQLSQGAHGAAQSVGLESVPPKPVAVGDQISQAAHSAAQTVGLESVPPKPTSTLFKEVRSGARVTGFLGGGVLL